MAAASITRRRAIILLALTSIILITLDLQNSSAVSGLRSLFGTVFHPIESVARVITRPLENTWHGIIDYNSILDENSRLRERVAQQEGATIAAAASVRLSQELLALNGLPTLAGINAVTAQVIGDSPSNFSQTIEINQGTVSGIRVGMPVLNAAGLVGKITKVYADRSVVMLITDCKEVPCNVAHADTSTAKANRGQACADELTHLCDIAFHSRLLFWIF